jgi:hypothetical protein
MGMALAAKGAGEWRKTNIFPRIIVLLRLEVQNSSNIQLVNQIWLNPVLRRLQMASTPGSGFVLHNFHFLFKNQKGSCVYSVIAPTSYLLVLLIHYLLPDSSGLFFTNPD